jgi:peroxiredoxin
MKLRWILLVLSLTVGACTDQSPDQQVVYDKELSATSLETAQELVVQANTLWEEQKFEEALVLVNRAIELVGMKESLLDYKCDLLFKLERGPQLLESTMLLEEIAEKKTPWNYLKIADAHVFLGNRDQAVDWIEKAVHEREFRKFTVFEAARYDLIRDDPRFRKVMAEILEDVKIGEPARDFVAKLVDGDELSLASLKGQVVLIDFWATWCSPCLKEMPNLETLYERLHGRGFEIISICLDEEEYIDRARSFFANNNYPWKFVFSELGYEDHVAKLYKVNGLPSTWLIDRDGILRRVGILGDELNQEVEKLLGSG